MHTHRTVHRGYAIYLRARIRLVRPYSLLRQSTLRWSLPTPYSECSRNRPKHPDQVDLGRTASTCAEGVFHSFQNWIVNISLVDAVGNGKHIHQTAAAREHHLLVIDRVATIAAHT